MTIIQIKINWSIRNKYVNQKNKTLSVQRLTLTLPTPGLLRIANESRPVDLRTVKTQQSHSSSSKGRYDCTTLRKTFQQTLKHSSYRRQHSGWKHGFVERRDTLPTPRHDPHGLEPEHSRERQTAACTETDGGACSHVEKTHRVTNLYEISAKREMLTG